MINRKKEEKGRIKFQYQIKARSWKTGRLGESKQSFGYVVGVGGGGVIEDRKNKRFCWWRRNKTIVSSAKGPLFLIVSALSTYFAKNKINK